MSKSKQYIIILAIGIIIMGLLVFFNLNNSTKTFSRNNISFDYPGSWQDYTEKASANNIEKYLAAVGDPNTAGANGKSMPTTAFIVTKTEDNANSTGDFPHPEGFMSKALIQSWVNTTNASNMHPNYINVKITTRNFTLSGLKAYEFTFTGLHTSNNKYEYTRIIAFEKRDVSKKKETYYMIMCTAMGSDIEKSKTMFDGIIDSFKVQ